MVASKILLAVLMLFCSVNISGGNIVEKDITSYFDLSSSIVVSLNNVETTLNRGDDKFEAILSALNDIVDGAHEMPAFAVSIDDMTREDKKSGIWIELEFEKTMSYNEMPFDALLIKVEKDYQAFNLIRRTNGKYQGRCFHLSLTKTMEGLYNKINSLSLNK